MKNTMDTAMEIAMEVRHLVAQNNPLLNNAFVHGVHVFWDTENRKMIFVPMGKYIYCGHITESYNFVRWSRERA